MFSLAKPTDKQIQELINSQQLLPFSYPEVGATNSTLPGGYKIDHNRIRLGSGERIFHRAVSAMRSWKMFDIEWVELCWPGAEIEVGSTVVVMASHFGFWSLHPASIVYVIDEVGGQIRRFGFAYGTLPGHGERGEERFLIEWNHKDDSVWYELLAFSRPNDLLAKIAYPISRMMQKKFASASKQAMLDAVNT